MSMIRCDIPMRRSKERCVTPRRTPWRCTLMCRDCPCAIIKEQNEEERHIGIAYDKAAKPKD